MIRLLSLLNEIQVIPPARLTPSEVKKKQLLYKLQNAPLINIQIGKYNIDKGQHGFEYSWNDAISKKIIQKATLNRVMAVCNKLGITPEKVWVGWYIYNSPTILNKEPYQIWDPINTNWVNNPKYPNDIKISDIRTNLKSTYVLAYYKNEPILFAQRQVHDRLSGQFYVLSKYVKSGKGARLGNDDAPKFIDYDPSLPNGTTKEEILKYLKIEQ